ncbi:MAG TPA: ABC transporter substrate-binding protein [Longimicrobiales bacterium]
MSTMPRQAAELVASEEPVGQPGHFEPVMAWSPGSSAQQAIEQANQFAGDERVLAVIGHANSASSIAASQIYNDAGLVQIAPTTTASVYGMAGPFSFRLVPSDTLQVAYLLMVREHHWPRARRIAIVHVNDDYGRGLFRELRPHLDSVVFEGMYADGADTLDMARLAHHIAEARPDLLFWLGRPTGLGSVIGRLRAALPDLTIVCGDACDAAAVYRNEDGRFTGLFFVRFTNPSAPDSALRRFQDRYRKLTGELASSEALLTYDAVSLVRAALRDGARTREEVRRWLLSLGGEREAFAGLTGAIEFDHSGTAHRRYLLAEVRRGGVGPAGHADR